MAPRPRRARLVRQLIASLLAVTLMCSFTGTLQRVPADQGEAVLISINVCDAGSAAAKVTGQAPCLPQAAYTVEPPGTETRHPEHPPTCPRTLVVVGLERPPQPLLCSA
jgi:hypothetical protein